MKKYFLILTILLTMALVGGCSWITAFFTISYELNEMGHTDAEWEMEYIDLTDDDDYDEHQDNIILVYSISVVADIINHGSLDASGELWIDTVDTWTTPLEIRDNAVKLFDSGPVHAGETLSIDWASSFTYMETDGIFFLQDLVINRGNFYVYGLPDVQPFDLSIDGEVVVTVIYRVTD